MSYYGIESDNALNHFVVVGCEDNTSVQIGSDPELTLNTVETYLWEDRESFTGTRLISNKPLAVFVGARCTFVPKGKGNCDHLYEQIPPTAAWGTNFLTASLATITSRELYRVIASTSVTINCTTFSAAVIYNLPMPGSLREFNTSSGSFCSITSNKPILVMEFSLGNRVNNDVGNPFMMMIVPVEQYLSTYVFTVSSDFSVNYITLYATPENFEPQNIFLNDSSLEDSIWVTVYCSDSDICGYITYSSLDPGDHTLHHTSDSSVVSLSVYGFDDDNSYGYPGGLAVAPVQSKSLVLR